MLSKNMYVANLYKVRLLSQIAAAYLYKSAEGISGISLMKSSSSEAHPGTCISLIKTGDVIFTAANRDIKINVVTHCTTE